MRMFKILISTLILLIFAGDVYAAADTAYDININVQTFQLDNGMLFVVVERPATPQVAIRLAIRAGSALEETGKTGIAHLLEHMLFKGTNNFGSLDYKKDQELQTRIEAAYQVVLGEQRKRQPNTTLIDKKVAEMEASRREVQKIYVPSPFQLSWAKTERSGSMPLQPRIKPNTWLPCRPICWSSGSRLPANRFLSPPGANFMLKRKSFSVNGPFAI